MADSEGVYFVSKKSNSKIDYTESSDSGIISDSDDEESVEGEEDYGRKFDEAMRYEMSAVTKGISSTICV